MRDRRPATPALETRLEIVAGPVYTYRDRAQLCAPHRVCLLYNGSKSALNGSGVFVEAAVTCLLHANEAGNHPHLNSTFALVVTLTVAKIHD